MRKSERITLLLVPESGGSTFEVKLHRRVLMAAGIGCCVVVLMLTLGAKSFVEARALSNEVAALQRQKAQLEDEVGQIEQLEQLLARLERSNRQLRAILGEPVKPAAVPGADEPQANDSASPDSETLRPNHVRS